MVIIFYVADDAADDVADYEADNAADSAADNTADNGTDDPVDVVDAGDGFVFYYFFLPFSLFFCNGSRCYGYSIEKDNIL